MKNKFKFYFCSTVALAALISQTNAFGYDLTDKFSVGGIMAGIWQYLQANEGGVNISGGIWGRKQDNIGLGVAYLDDGETEIGYSLVTEAYVRFVLNDMFAATADLQYLADDVDGGQDLNGWIGSVRVTAEF